MSVTEVPSANATKVGSYYLILITASTSVSRRVS